MKLKHLSITKIINKKIIAQLLMSVDNFNINTTFKIV